MDELSDWLRSALLTYRTRLQSTFSLDSRLAPAADIKRVLLHWGIDTFHVKRNLTGTSKANWLIQTPKGLYVLRRTEDGDEWLSYQIRVMRHLSSSDFPYNVPIIVEPDRCSDYVFDGRYYWLLYGFLEGTHAPQPNNPRRARNVGALVAHYDRVLENIELGELAGRFCLRLFEIKRVAHVLSEGAQWMLARRDRSGLAAVFLKHVDSMLHVYCRTPPCQIKSVGNLPKITVYYDWHRYNVLDRSGSISGLIDYDSIAEAPRIVDFQNALTYVLISKDNFDRDLVLAFSEGYNRILPLSPLEASLVCTIMLDRVAWLVADIIDQVRREGTSPREGIAIHFIRLFAWLSENRHRLTGDLMTHARPE